MSAERVCGRQHTDHLGTWGAKHRLGKLYPPLGSFHHGIVGHASRRGERLRMDIALSIL